MIMLGCLLLAAIADGLGMSTLLPLLSMVTETSSGPEAEQVAQSALEQTVGSVLASVGLTPTLGTLLLTIVFAMSLKAALVLLAQRQIGYTVAQVATDLRLDLIRALLASRWQYYVRKPVGLLSNSFATEALRASQAYLHGTTIISLGIQAAVYSAIAIATSWQATVGAAILGTLTVAILNRLVRMTRKAGARQTRLLKTLLGRLTDVLYAVKPLKAMARENLIGPLLEKETQKLNRALQKEVLSKEGLRAIHEPLLVATICVGLWVAITRWGLPLDRVILLALLFGRLLGHIGKMQKQLQRVAACESAYWSMRETIDDAERQQEVLSGAEQASLSGDIKLDGVTFGYGDKQVLDDVSLTIPKGELTVIVGPSGAGKTSIVDLVSGLVRPQSGDVYIDKTAVGDVDLKNWRRRIGYVPQETFLLHESVFVNVSLGDPEIDESRVEQALRAAGAWAFVEAMPEGMHTPVGERGIGMSGGQRQRIAIARALVHDPSLLILDEATASLDPESEAEVCETVERLRGDMTVLGVSHQAALLGVADKVYRLEGGSVREAEPKQSNDVA
jgi:ATP-binding cassette subfamily C protein